MHSRVRIALAVLLVAVVGVIAWQTLREREPVYQGKRLSFWLQRYSFEADSPEVDKAVRSMGTNAIPTLLENLQATDSALKRTLAALGLRYTPPDICHMRADKGFSALGAVASNAVPALIEIYEQNTSPSGRYAAANALIEIGPAAKTAIPALMKSTASTNSDVRAFALYTLGRLALESKLVVPVLIKGLHDPEQEVCFSAASGLEWLASMGGDLEPAIPALLETLKDRHPCPRAAAAIVLGCIHSEPAVVVTALMEMLRDSNVQLHAFAAEALGRFRDNGKPAVPALIELLSEGNQDDKKAAADALKQIDPEAAAKTGVK